MVTGEGDAVAGRKELVVAERQDAHHREGARPSASTSEFAGRGDAGDGGPTLTGAGRNKRGGLTRRSRRSASRRQASTAGTTTGSLVANVR
jgi:hypothetical protein